MKYLKVFNESKIDKIDDDNIEDILLSIFEDNDILEYNEKNASIALAEDHHELSRLYQTIRYSYPFSINYVIRFHLYGPGRLRTPALEKLLLDLQKAKLRLGELGYESNFTHSTDKVYNTKVYVDFVIQKIIS